MLKNIPFAPRLPPRRKSTEESTTSKGILAVYGRTGRRESQPSTRRSTRDLRKCGHRSSTIQGSIAQRLPKARHNALRPLQCNAANPLVHEQSISPHMHGSAGHFYSPSGTESARVKVNRRGLTGEERKQQHSIICLKGKLRQKLKLREKLTSCSLRGAESNGRGPRKLRRSIPT